MKIVKYNSVCYNGGVDISNTVAIKKAEAPVKQEAVPEGEAEIAPEEAAAPEPVISAEEILAEREAELKAAQAELEERKKELAALKEQYIEQGKAVILEAKRRAEGIVDTAEQQSDEILREADKSRDDIFIKARAEGYEQGKKDGAAMLLKEGQGALNDARRLCERINEEKAALFDRYEKEIFETVMAIANKVTMNSMSVKDGTAAKKLIKAAAKEFRNADALFIRLNDNGASREIAADYDFLSSLCTGRVEVELLEHAPEGTVTVDDDGEIIDAGIQTQLHMIRELAGGKYAENPALSHLESVHLDIRDDEDGETEEKPAPRRRRTRREAADEDE